MDNLEEIFRRYERPLYAYMLRMIGDPHEAEEVTQETFVRAFTAAMRFKGQSSVRTWLFGIGKNVAREALRRPRTMPVPETHAAPHVDPTDAIFLGEALSRLEPDDREVLVLVDVLGFKPKELAEVIATSPEAARVRLHRARKRLRESVEERLGGTSDV